MNEYTHDVNPNTLTKSTDSCLRYKKMKGVFYLTASAIHYNLHLYMSVIKHKSNMLIIKLLNLNENINTLLFSPFALVEFLFLRAFVVSSVL